MSYSGLIDANLTRAFNMVKDLAVDAILTRRNGTEFDFSTGDSTQASTTNTVVKVIVVDTKKPAKDTNTASKQVMFKNKEVGDLTLIDTLTVNGIAWRIGDIISNSGFVTLAQLSKA